MVSWPLSLPRWFEMYHRYSDSKAFVLYLGYGVRIPTLAESYLFLLLDSLLLGCFLPTLLNVFPQLLISQCPLSTCRAFKVNPTVISLDRLSSSPAPHLISFHRNFLLLESSYSSVFSRAFLSVLLYVGIESR